MAKSTFRFIRPREAKGVEVQEVVNSTHSFPNHTHDYHSIGVMDVGGVYCRQPGSGSSFLRRGELALFNPGLVHSGVIKHSGTKINYRVFSFENDLFSSCGQELSEKLGLPEFREVVVKDELALSLLAELNLAVHGEASQLTVDTAISRAVAALLTRHCEVQSRITSNNEPVAVKRVREYLRENLSDKVLLDELASLAGLSRYHLLRVFRKSVGLPPHSYHVQLRIEHAKRLLRSGDPIAEVALGSGFSDQSHFSNTFKRYTGATPTQYVAG